jgi:3-dehydroquinate synthase
MYPLPSTLYPLHIHIETKQFSQLRQMLQNKHYSSLWILVDENTKRDCLPILMQALEGIVVPNYIEIAAGEQHKNIDSCQYIWQELLAGQADRKALLLNLGGGVIGDMGGFCASTYKRGMDFVQIPTTLLAQVDASVGGKLGIDFQMVKNAIGVFGNPQMVCIFPDFLQSLPKRELYSGFAEIVKHALIADKAHWKKIQSLQDLSDENIDWTALIAHSVAIKSQVVSEDPYEKGLRKILNFGHTIGHAIESLSWEGENPLLHGEAVAIGMVCEAYLSHIILGLPEEELKEIIDYLRSIYSAYDLSNFEEKELLALMYQDKKNEGKGIAFSLLPAIGQAQFNVSATEMQIIESLHYYDKYFR